MRCTLRKVWGFISGFFSGLANIIIKNIKNNNKPFIHSTTDFFKGGRKLPPHPFLSVAGMMSMIDSIRQLVHLR